MNKEHLLKLADFLDTMPPQKFDFKHIIKVGKYPPEEAIKLVDQSCGTVGCAIGWMPAVFPDLVRWGSDCVESRMVGQDGWRNKDFDVAVEVFDVADREVDFLFLPGGYGSPCDHNSSARQIAAHIRTFVEYGGIYTGSWKDTRV